MDSDAGLPVVVTVGGSPSPLLAALLALRPHTVHALISAESEPVWDRTLAAYRKLAGPTQPPLDSRCFKVAPHDIGDVERVCRRAAADWHEWSLAYAGGTPAMTGGAIRHWWRSQSRTAGGGGDRRQPSAWYVAEHGDVLINEHGGTINVRTELEGRNLTLADLLTLHGATALGSPDARHPLDAASDIGVLRDSLRQLPCSISNSERPAADARLLDIFGRSLAVIGAPLGTHVYAPSTARLTAVDGREHVMRLPHAAITGFTLRLFRCMAFQPQDQAPRPTGGVRPVMPRRALRRQSVRQAKEALFETHWLARMVGGLHGRSAVLCSADGRSGEMVADILWSDLGPDTDPGDISAGGPENPRALAAFSLSHLHRELNRAENGRRPGALGRWLAYE